jgi:hypothetical protein
MALEKATNPFLRCHTPGLQKVTHMEQEVAVFCALREMKNRF